MKNHINGWKIDYTSEFVSFCSILLIAAPQTLKWKTFSGVLIYLVNFQNLELQLRKVSFLVLSHNYNKLISLVQQTRPVDNTSIAKLAFCSGTYFFTFMIVFNSDFFHNNNSLSFWENCNSGIWQKISYQKNHQNYQITMHSASRSSH